MVSSVRTPKNVGSLAKFVRRYGADQSGLPVVRVQDIGAEQVAGDAERRLVQQGEANVIVGIRSP